MTIVITAILFAVICFSATLTVLLICNATPIEYYDPEEIERIERIRQSIRKPRRATITVIHQRQVR